MKIAFVGDEECSLQNMIMSALGLYSKREKSVILIDISFRSENIENAFKNNKYSYVKEEACFAIREGMDYLLYRCTHNMLNSAVVHEGVTYLLPDFAYIKTAIQGNDEIYINNITENISKLLEEAEKAFDIILVMCSNNWYNNIIKIFDMCVCNIAYDKINEIPQKLQCLKNNCELIIVGQVIEDCKVLEDKLYNQYRSVREKIFVIPYNPRLEIKLFEGEIIDFYERRINNVYDKIYFTRFEKALHKLKKIIETKM